MDRLEMLSVEVRKLSTKPFVITTQYRPPNSSVDLFSHLQVDILLRKLDTENIEHYNPPINFRVILLPTLRHVVQITQ